MALHAVRRSNMKLGAQLMFVLLVVSGAMAAVPTCRKFEAYLQCGPPVEEFRAPEMDLKCDEFVVGAGYCVCAEEECKDEANWIRVEIDCAPLDLVAQATETGHSSESRSCVSVCAKYESNMWIYGVISSIGASCATAGGLIIQKMAQMKFQALSEDERPYSVAGCIFAPLWIIGFLLICLVPLPFNLMAVTFAAASLVAPLASVTLVLNQILAPFALGETLSRADIVGTIVIVAGVVLATIFGSHCESSYTPDDLLMLYTRLPFLIAATFSVVSMCVALAVIKSWRTTMPEHISAHDMEMLESGAPTRVCIAYAFIAGTMGALMQIVFKGTGELIGGAEFGHWALWMSIALVCIIGAAQMSYLNQGMAVCNAIVFFPTYNACFIVMTTLSGITYYEEYKALTGVAVWTCFGGGVTCVMVGVLVLTRKTTSKVADLAVAELESQQNRSNEDDEVVIEDLLAQSSQAVDEAAAFKDSDVRGISPPPILARSRSGTPSQERRPTAVRLANIHGERRGSFSALMVTSSGIIVPPSPAASNSTSPVRHSSFEAPPLSRSSSVDRAKMMQHPTGRPQNAVNGDRLSSSLDSSILRGAMPTIPGGDTPLASLTAEDAAAFLALSAAQRERAGQLSQEQLDASIQRALERGEFDDRLHAGEGTGQAGGNEEGDPLKRGQ